MMRIFTSLILTMATLATLSAQIGGRYTYEFLGLPSSARETALGTSLITIADDDVNLAIANPALLSPQTHQSLAVNHNFHFADISNGTVDYGFAFNRLGMQAHIGAKYANYGDFTAADRFGNRTGNFSASEVAIHLGASRPINERITLGANIKVVNSSLESYSSLGLATDLGLLYHTPNSKSSFAIVVKNLGTELSTYTDQRLSAPLDIQVAYSKQLNHLPFRFTVTAHQLQQWDIRYDDPNTAAETDLFGNTQEDSQVKKEIDNLFRHLIFSGEFLLGKSQNLRLRLAYNHFRRAELSVEDLRSLAGFSGGFGIKINRFRIDYGLGYHHLAGAANHLTISTNLQRFRKKL